jgi:aspartyl aminopeptidase
MIHELSDTKKKILQIREKDDWEKDLKAGGKYYFTRNQSALLAFTIPQKWKQGAGVSIVATHVDSPNLRVRHVLHLSGPKHN